MNRFKKFIEKNVGGKKVLVLFVLTNLVYAFMLLVTIPKTMVFSEGMQLLDMLPTGYDYKYVNELFNTLGETGRETYLTSQLPVDMVYPLLFGISYCLLMGYFLKKIDKLHTPYILLCALPIIGGIADYFENIGIITMLYNYPNIAETTVNTTSTFSVIKSISTTMFFVTLMIVLLLLGIKAIKKTRNTKLH